MSENNSSNDYNSIFDYNTQEEVADAENMNRDYLNGIYGENMSFLNKDIRLTRTQYYKRKQDIENSFEKELKSYKKRILLFTLLSVLLLVFGILSIFMAQRYNSLYQEAYKLISLSKAAQGTVGDQQLAHYLRLGAGVFGTMAAFFVTTAVFMFSFFNTGLIKQIFRLKKNRESALNHLEDLKKECMLLGVYDAIK